MRKKHWYEWLWVALLVYFFLPFHNILFGWIGLAFIIAPIVITAWRGDKEYCNRYCGRGQLYQLIGSALGFGRERPPPRFLRQRWFRYSMLFLFLGRFALLMHGTVQTAIYADAQGAAVWTWLFYHPWETASAVAQGPGPVNFAYGIYSAMALSTILGMLTMVFLRPRSWCVYCPMGTVTHEICRIRNRGAAAASQRIVNTMNN